MNVSSRYWSPFHADEWVFSGIEQPKVSFKMVRIQIFSRTTREDTREGPE